MKKALLEYFVAKDKTFLFVIRSDVDGPPLVKEIPYGTEFWARQRSEFYRAVLFANPYRTRAFEREISEFYDLGEILLKPALSHLSGVQMLYIVPHGDLHYLPFHGMRIPTADGDRLAITEFQIVYLPSASVLRFCQQKNPARQGGTKVNNPLVLGTWAANDPDAFRSAICAETQELATLFKARPLMGLEASKPRFLAQAPGADLLHLACHGSFIASPDTMSTTGLLLNNGRVFPTAAYSDGPHPPDTFLTASEMAALSLNCHLVTLSACQTGQTRLHPGDELVGLSRALFYSGAPSILLTLWRVNVESKRQFIAAFYRAWLGDMAAGKAVAVQRAKLELLNESAFNSLYHWGPYFLLGDWL